MSNWSKYFNRDELVTYLLVIAVGASGVLIGNYAQIRTVEAEQVVKQEQPASNDINDLSNQIFGSTTNAEPVDTTEAEVAQTSPAETTKAVTPTGLVNINSATLAELDTLPGIGPAYARRIIDYRQANGPYVSIEQLLEIKGIGPATLNKIRAQVTL